MEDNLIYLKNIPWARNNKFDIRFIPVGSYWVKLNNGNFVNMVTDIFPHAVISTTLPDFVDTPLEEYIAEEWKISRGRQENFLITVTLRTDAEMLLYDFFSKSFLRFERIYPEDQYASIEINTSTIPEKGTNITFEKCILVGVSGLSLDNSANDGLLEFSVTFKTGHLKLV